MHTMAVIGYGGMGAWHVENVMNSLPDLRVKGVWDIRPEALGKAKEKGVSAYTSLEALLADKEVELVTIATPNDSHKPLALAALAAGKHVVCEKPVALCAADLGEMLAAAEAAGRLFTVHQNRRWDKDYRIVKAALEAGTLGAAYFIESRVQGSRRAMYGWRGHKQNGGGMLLDWGVHLIDQLLDMVPSPVVAVTANLVCLYSDEVDDNIKLTLTFKNGTVALLEMSTNCLINQPRWHIQGRKATLVVEDWSCGGRIVRLAENGPMEWDDDIVYTAAGPTRTMAPRPRETTLELPLPKVESEWVEFYRNIAAVLEGKETPIVTGQQALRVMQVVDLAFEANRVGHGLACEI